MAGNIYVGQIGVKFLLDTSIIGEPEVEWSSATLTEIVCLRPDGTQGSWPALVQQGTVLTYITANASDLPIPGEYKLQARVVGPLFDVLGDTVGLTVLNPFT